ncbi:TRAFAC clade GTPase domain-containing protein [Celerinatantimonas diazotrophica]|uniref:Double-GTPase 2 domain-containing protein n=1 Tax=Celerinatantimonas diazotrophica TaxID=412034 RepID=A0A4R1K1B3_9GAMM|nr:GTPase domain-containing protein [Celerinatantimonas diazotrophica]TCK57755.1 hypothetical protein EV690_1449 [Celerinatantimonas diazotrophica]CAG9298183.1 hypothetical protein CEDIAZO_03378 [Celerinatantimonas diazotrophica]
MVGSCSNPNCYAADGESCALGEPDHKKCCNWISDPKNPSKTNSGANEEAVAYKIPWSGSALGINDFIKLTPRGRSILIGILGAENSGKTTFLVGSYLKLLAGSSIDNKAFCGSQTLGAWESLASWVRFDDINHLSSFPPHTPRSLDRVPGILHLALKDITNSQHRDVLLTDAPGEWFSSWSLNENNQEAEGAQWVVKNSDAFIIFADSEKLSGSERGQARNELRQLIERLSDHIGDKPVFLFWAKSDQKPNKTIVSNIRKTLSEKVNNSHELSVSVENNESLVQALSSVIHEVWLSPLADQIKEPVCIHSPFYAFRGRV